MPTRQRDPHVVRQKRLVRHAIASGEDMPPLGYKDRSEFFKERGRATDSQAYWAGPVTERPEPWRDPRQSKQRPSSSQKPSRVHTTSEHFASSRNSHHDQRGQSAPKQRNSLVTKSQVRAHRKSRPKSAASVTVLSMLEFERKTALSASSSAPRLRPRGISHSSVSHDFVSRPELNGHRRQRRSQSAVPIRRSVTKKTKKSKRRKGRSTKLLSETSIASSVLSESNEEDLSSLTASATKDGLEAKKAAAPMSTLEWATSFMSKMKERLKEEESLYVEFIREVQKGDGSVSSLLSVAKAVLVDHKDLYFSLKDFVRNSGPSSDHVDILSQSKQSNHRRRNLSKKRRVFTWILDVARTDAPGILSKKTLKRLSTLSPKKNLAYLKNDPSRKATGRYQGSGGGRFSTAFPLSSLDRAILDASRSPGPSDYQNPKAKRSMSGGRFSTARPKSDVDWVIYHAKQRPGPLDYKPKSIRMEGGVKFSDSNPKSYLDWAIFNSQQVPGPLRYDISKCMY